VLSQLGPSPKAVSVSITRKLLPKVYNAYAAVSEIQALRKQPSKQPVEAM